MLYQCIAVDIADRIATITLNRPDRLNAISFRMASEINSALDNLGDVRCLIITAAGTTFCAGSDVEANINIIPIAGSGLNSCGMTQYLISLLTRLSRSNFPIITAVNGAAFDIGCLIGLCGDFVIASKSGHFQYSKIGSGHFANFDGALMLPQLASSARAVEMMLLGEKVFGEKAATWGMIYKCVDDSELAIEARALSIRLRSGPVIAYAAARKNILSALSSTNVP